VNRIPPKQPRQRLDPELYERLRQQVLRRDAWRCQCCGTRSNLEVHHREFRSQGGDDSEENLITLCALCHSLFHRSSPVSSPCGGQLLYELKSRWQEILFNFLDYLPSRRQWHPVSNMHLPLLGMVGLYDPLAILAITNQFYERAIRLHATKQTLNAFFGQAVPNRGPKHLEPPQPDTKSLQAFRSETQVVSAGTNPVCPLERSALFQK